MRGTAEALGLDLGGEAPPADSPELRESLEFLRWLADDHFTFLGYREYDLVAEEEGRACEGRPGSGLGILRDEHRPPTAQPTPGARRPRWPETRIRSC